MGWLAFSGLCLAFALTASVDYKTRRVTVAAAFQGFGLALFVWSLVLAVWAVLDVVG